jgi:hypothetical protein
MCQWSDTDSVKQYSTPYTQNDKYAACIVQIEISSGNVGNNNESWRIKAINHKTQLTVHVNKKQKQ